MRSFRCAILCLSAVIALAQSPRPPTQRVPLKVLPPPPAHSHGHGPDNRAGTTPCGYRGVQCPGTSSPKSTSSQPPYTSSTYQPPVSGRGGVTPAATTPTTVTRGHGSYAWPIGLGVGALGGLAIWSLTENAAHDATQQLSRDGPQFSNSLRMSDFQVSGFARGGWPVVIDYDAEPGAYILLTVVTQNAAPAETVLASPPTGRRLELVGLPNEFGTTLKVADFSLHATTSATDLSPRYLRIYGFGCGPRAVGSVAIDELSFGPSAITAAQPDAKFGFHAHTTFDKMKAEFMQVAMVDRSLEGQLFDQEKIPGRVAEGETLKDEHWSAKKAKPGQIQFRVRGWMTVHDDNGGDWVSAFSPDLVLKQ